MKKETLYERDDFMVKATCSIKDFKTSNGELLVSTHTPDTNFVELNFGGYSCLVDAQSLIRAVDYATGRDQYPYQRNRHSYYARRPICHSYEEENEDE